MKDPFHATSVAGDEVANRDVEGWTRLERTWVGLVALLFSSTGSLKLYGGLAAPSRLDTSERVFDLPMSDWSLAAGTLELVWVAILVSSPGPGVSLAIVRFLFGAVLVYRGLLSAFGGGYCGCLGGLLSETPWQSHEGLLLGSVAVVGFLANEACLALRRRRAEPFSWAMGRQATAGCHGRSTARGNLEPDLWT